MSVFEDCVNLKNIKIPPTVKEIGDYSFVRCKGLEIMELPAGLLTLGSGVFRECSGIKSIEIPASVREIKSNILAKSNIELKVSPENMQTVRLLKTRLKRTLARLFLTLALWEGYASSWKIGCVRLKIGFVG
jgi:hypothetical protein